MYLHKRRAIFSSNGHGSEKERELIVLTETFYRSILDGKPDWKLFDGTPYNEFMERLQGEGDSSPEPSDEQNLYDLVTEHLRLNGTKPDVIVRPDGSVYLSLAAAAGMLGLERQTMRDYTAKGKIEPERIEGHGNISYFNTEELWSFDRDRLPKGRPPQT